MSVSFQRSSSMAFRDLFGDFEADGVGFGAAKPSQSQSSPVTFDFLSGDFQQAMSGDFQTTSGDFQRAISGGFQTTSGDFQTSSGDFQAAEMGSSMNCESKRFESAREIESYISEIMSDTSSDIDSISSPFSTNEESILSESPIHQQTSGPVMPTPTTPKYENFMPIAENFSTQFTAPNSPFRPNSPLSGPASPVETHGSCMGSPLSQHTMESPHSQHTMESPHSQHTMESPHSQHTMESPHLQHTINEYGTEFDIDQFFDNACQSSPYADQTPIEEEPMVQHDQFFQLKMTANSPSFVEEKLQVYESYNSVVQRMEEVSNYSPPEIAPSSPSFSPSPPPFSPIPAGNNFTIIQSPEIQPRPNTPECTQSTPNQTQPEGSQIIKMNDVTYIVTFQSQPIVLHIANGNNAQIKTERMDLAPSPTPQKIGQKRPLSPIQLQDDPTPFVSKKLKGEIEEKPRHRNSDRKRAQNKRASKKYREGIKKREEQRRQIIAELEMAKNRKKEELAKLEGKNEVLKDQLLAKYAQLL
jgi:hypothetical protein